MWSFYGRYIVSVWQIYRLCRLENTRLWRKIMKTDPKQIHMAPFGLIFIQDGSHELWEASGMPPGPQNAPGKSKNPGFLFFPQDFHIFPYHPSTATYLWYLRCVLLHTFSVQRSTGPFQFLLHEWLQTSLIPDSVAVCQFRTKGRPDQHESIILKVSL